MKRSLLPILLLTCCLLASACGKGESGGNAAQQAQGTPSSANAAAQSNQQPAQKSDVEFVRENLGRMVEGEAAVEEAIDWESFVALQEDFGAEYKKWDEARKVEERRDFIKNFSREYKGAGGDLGRATNWREESKDDGKTVVAVDTHTGTTLLLTVTRKAGRQMISRLDARDTGPEK